MHAGIDRRYFERHWHSDPTHDVSDVLVAVAADGHDDGDVSGAGVAGADAATAKQSSPRFVSSLRVFRRTV